MRRDEFGLLLLILFRHLLGITACRFSGFELFVLDRNEFCAE